MANEEDRSGRITDRQEQLAREIPPPVDRRSFLKGGIAGFARTASEDLGSNFGRVGVLFLIVENCMVSSQAAFLPW
jgi:hypothetical protein